MRKISLLSVIILIGMMLLLFGGCSASTSGTKADSQRTVEVANRLQANQPTPTDINYSLERYNLIRRTYWVNGQREKANALPCSIEKPLGYVVLFSNDLVVGSFIVDGKISSLNSYLTPDSEYYEILTSDEGIKNAHNDWLADVDGSYGENDSGIFFFTPDGKYVEWTGTYLYSDIPFEISTPTIVVKEAN